MRVDVIMPQMGESIAEGTLTKWLKKAGDKVARDEPIFEISTDKVDAEIPSPAAGVLAEIRVPAGSTVHFWATSKDLVHGLFVPRHNVNVMLLPGQIAHAQARFDTPGEYPIICHEYCGVAHHTMAGKIIVEAKR